MMPQPPTSEAERESQLRATAVAERRVAEATATAAERRAELAAQALATAEAELSEAETVLPDPEMQPPGEQPEEVEKATALRLARTSPTLLAIATGEVRFFVDPLPTYAAGEVDGAVAGIVEALEDFDLYGTRIMQTSVEADADILVKWARDYDDHIHGLAINQTVINVGLGKTNCLGSWQAFDAETVRRIVWHELGHTFGYSHSADRMNIMYPPTDTRFAVDEELERVSRPVRIGRSQSAQAEHTPSALRTRTQRMNFDMQFFRWQSIPRTISTTRIWCRRV